MAYMKGYEEKSKYNYCPILKKLALSNDDLPVPFVVSLKGWLPNGIKKAREMNF